MRRPGRRRRSRRRALLPPGSPSCSNRPGIETIWKVLPKGSPDEEVPGACGDRELMLLRLVAEASNARRRDRGSRASRRICRGRPRRGSKGGGRGFRSEVLPYLEAAAALEVEGQYRPPLPGLVPGIGEHGGGDSRRVDQGDVEAEFSAIPVPCPFRVLDADADLLDPAEEPHRGFLPIPGRRACRSRSNPRPDRASFRREARRKASMVSSTSSSSWLAEGTMRNST